MRCPHRFHRLPCPCPLHAPVKGVGFKVNQGFHVLSVAFFPCGRGSFPSPWQSSFPFHSPYGHLSLHAHCNSPFSFPLSFHAPVFSVAFPFCGHSAGHSLLASVLLCTSQTWSPLCALLRWSAPLCRGPSCPSPQALQPPSPSSHVACREVLLRRLQLVCSQVAKSGGAPRARRLLSQVAKRDGEPRARQRGDRGRCSQGATEDGAVKGRPRTARRGGVSARRLGATARRHRRLELGTETGLWPFGMVTGLAVRHGDCALSAQTRHGHWARHEERAPRAQTRQHGCS